MQGGQSYHGNAGNPRPVQTQCREEAEAGHYDSTVLMCTTLTRLCELCLVNKLCIHVFTSSTMVHPDDTGLERRILAYLSGLTVTVAGGGDTPKAAS